MRRSSSVLVAGFLISALAAAPAGAGVENNPNGSVIGPVVCDNGLAFEAVLGTTDQSFVGLDAASNIAGVAKAIWLATENGDKVALLTKPINEKLASLTVFCWWPAPEVPTGYVGGDILFRKTIR